MDHYINVRSQSLAIIMPALNEAGAIGQQIAALCTYFTCPALPVPCILVVDNGSTDGTAHVARAVGAEVISEPRRGYGFACLAGVRAAIGADVILLMDADGSDDLAGAVHLAEMVMCGEADLAMGSRALGQVEAHALTPQQRVGNAVGALLLRLLYSVRVSDIGPTRAIRRDALLRLDMREMGYGWSVEMLAKAARAGLRIHELPVDYHARTAGRSKVSGTLRGTLLASQHILRTLVRYRRWRPPQTSTGAARTTPRRALFVVVRVPTLGMTKTRLGRAIGHEPATALYAAFVRDLGARLTSAARRDGYDLYWFYTDPAAEGTASLERLLPSGSALLPQAGAGLGERLLHGFRTLQARGYDEIAVLGSDSPHIPVTWIHEAFDALKSDDLVLGPARDGGYYLLALRAHREIDDVFTGITMSTPSVCAETVERATVLGRSLRLGRVTFDVDESDDLLTLYDALSTAPSADADPAPATYALLRELRAGTGRMREATLSGAQAPMGWSSTRLRYDGSISWVGASKVSLLRVGALLGLGILALPLYWLVLRHSATLDATPIGYLWPELGLTLVAVLGAWLVLTRTPVPVRWAGVLELAVILVVGGAFRLLAFPSLPTLSHDAYRYAWDAHLVAHDVSPYVHPVNDPALASLRDGAIWPYVNWRNAVTIYPPGAQLFFLAVHAVAPLNIWAMKVAIELCDVLAGVVTLLLLRQRSMDPRRVILYWWSPIPVVEFAANAHIDAAAVLWLLVALLLANCALRPARMGVGTFLGLAALTKLYPLIFALAFLRRRDWGFVLGLAATLLFVYLPFIRLGLGGGGFLGTYVSQRFVDQGILFRLLGNVAPNLAAQVALVGLAGVLLCGAVACMRWRGMIGVEASLLALSAVWIALSPHLFPWYVAGVLPLLALTPSARGYPLFPLPLPALALWLFVLLMPFTYVIFAPHQAPEIFQLFFAVPLVVAAIPLARALLCWLPGWPAPAPLD